MKYYVVLYYQYLSFLKRYLPSYLGIEDAVSSSIIATLFFLKFLIAYFLFSRYLIQYIYFNTDIFFLLYFSTIILFHFILTKKKIKSIKRNKLKNDNEMTYKINYISVLYPLIIISVFILTLKLVFG